MDDQLSTSAYKFKGDYSRCNTEADAMYQSKQNYSTEASSVRLTNSSLPIQKQEEKKSRFAGEKIIGNGSFGVVYQARVVETGEVVAVKKVFQDRRYKNRELQIMQELHHPNIIHLKYSFTTHEESEEEVYLNLVMDYIPETLYRIFKYYKKKSQPFPNNLIKLYAYQLLRGLAYLHSLNVCHRDIKPQNLLVDPATHMLKICDFGSAKKLVKGENNVAYICSRYYRAPELIFGATDYTTLIDVWSAGCVIAEIMLGEPIFPGESGTTQLVEIIKILGTPTKEQILEMNPKAEGLKCPDIKAVPWTKVFKKADPLAIDLISKLLVYEPNKRLHPQEALLHPYFNDLKEQNFKVNGSPAPDLFDFTQQELMIKPEIADRLIPNWYKNHKGLY